MKISARNILKGTIAEINEGAVNGVVKIKMGEDTISADITMEAIKSLELEVGKEAFAIIKASSVMFATEKITGISARNQLAGEVAVVNKGAVNGHVSLKLENGTVVKGSITNEAIDALALEAGKPAVAIIKSTEVMVGVE